MARSRMAAGVGAVVLGAASVVSAHVTIWPKASQAGGSERYTIRVPTEGKVATSGVEVEIPADVAVVAVQAGAASYDATRDGDRITAITWKLDVKPGEFTELGLLARNPKSGTRIAWKVRQRFADGSVSEWTGPPGDRRAGPVTTLLPADATAQGTGADIPIATMLRTYDAAFNARDLQALGRLYDPDVTIFEGGGVNNGWADYRDHHLGPELQAFTNLQFGHRNRHVRMLGPDTALVTSEYVLKGRLKDRDVDATGLETLIVGRTADGAWTIRHSHVSSRRRP